ncbi:hypothetical protein Tco_0269369 [Tanacetum coccineum]
MEVEEIKLNPFKDSDDFVPIPRVSVTPLDSLDSFFDSYDTSYTNPSKLDSEYTLNYDNPIFNIQNEHSDEPETETIMDEVYNIVQIPPLFEGNKTIRSEKKRLEVRRDVRVIDCEYIDLLGYEDELLIYREILGTGLCFVKGSSSFMGCSNDKSLLGCDYVGSDGFHGESSCEGDSVDDSRLVFSFHLVGLMMYSN